MCRDKFFSGAGFLHHYKHHSNPVQWFIGIMTYKNVLIQIFACSYDVPHGFYKVNQKKESSVDLSIFFLFFFCRMEVMKTRKAVYLLQGNTSHVYPIAYLLDNCLEDFCTCLWLENYRGCLSITKSSFSWLSACGQF